MKHETIARKWRPQQFTDVVGQEHIIKVLQSQVLNERVGHAYLFFGPRGTGKTTLARLFAKTINCPDLWEGEPCNECQNCLEITNDRSIDVIEIDAASNRGVDQIRELKENVKLTPTQCKYKVYIIDEVHMLTREAFNALLKTLEEPPSNVVFILATTEYNKIPATIISRCQDFEFHYLLSDKVIDKLKIIAKNEGISIDDEALLLLSKHSDGCLRDAENLLERLSFASNTGESITISEAENLLGLSSSAVLKQLIDSILNNNLVEGLSLIDKLSKQGLNLIECVNDLIDYFRKLRLLCKDNEKETLAKSLDITSIELQAFRENASNISFEKASRIVKILVKTAYEIRLYNYPQIQFETALIDIHAIKDPVNINRIISKLSELEHKMDTHIATEPITSVKTVKTEKTQKAEDVSKQKTILEGKGDKEEKTKKTILESKEKRTKKRLQKDPVIEKILADKEEEFKKKKNLIIEEGILKNTLGLFEADIIEVI